MNDSKKEILDFLERRENDIQLLTKHLANAILDVELNIKDLKIDIKEIKDDAKANGVKVATVMKALNDMKAKIKRTQEKQEELDETSEFLNDSDIISKIMRLNDKA